MTLAPIRLAIDVSKRWLDIHDAGCGRTWRIANREPQIAELLATLPPRSTIVLEATAPYDTELRRLASAAGHALNRLNPSRARDFARAAGFLAKTDAIDARMLAHMAATLPAEPEPAYDAAREALAALHRRRDQLVECRAVERGRIADVREASERKSLQRHIAWLDREIASLERQIRATLDAPAFQPIARILRSMRGIGQVTLTTLIVLMPELGQRSAKTIAALAGLAPLNRDSGAFRGQRRIAGGRRRVRQALYMAALAAIRAVPRFKAHYTAIKQRSGHAKVAIIAVARKLLTILNAMLREQKPWQTA